MKEGDRVKKGQLLLKFDMDVIKAHGLETITPVVLTNTDDLQSVSPVLSVLRNKEENKMKSFNYTITDEVGIHARPAGMLAKKVKEYASTVVIAKGEKSAQAQKLMAVMSLGVKNGETVTVTVEGDDEETAAVDLEKFFRENL